MKTTRLRSAILKIHLCLGLAAAVFLVILGLTGSIMAFENDIDHWMHPGLWYVTAGPRSLAEEELMRGVEQRFAPARVAAVEIFRARNLARVMQLTDRTMVFVNPYNGAVLGQRKGPSGTEKVLGAIHQLHLRLVFEPRSAPRFARVGKLVISFAGLILCLMVPTGVYLWWRTKRASVSWKGSWFRLCFDAHYTAGIYGAVFLLVAAFTGVLIGFDFGEEAIYAVTRSSRPDFRQRPPQSTPVAGAARITVDQAIAQARAAMPDATAAGVFLPRNPKAAYLVLMRVPEETSEAVHSTVSVDQYGGQVLQVRNFKTDSLGYRVIRFNRSIHTGDVFGLPSHILVSLSSLLLVVMVVTGAVIWWKKLAV